MTSKDRTAVSGLSPSLVTEGRQSSRDSAFTLLELLVVIAVLAVLAALLLPALSCVKRHARHLVCKNNLHQTGLALGLYLADFEKFPVARFPWSFRLIGYCGGSSNCFFCPMTTSDVLYGYNYDGTGLLGLGGLDLEMYTPVPESRVLAPCDMLAFGDGGYGWLAGFGWPGEYGPGWHGDYRMNAVFCDAHVETSQCNLLPHRALVDQPGVLFFTPDSALAKRWNRDNQPHPETWPQSP